MKYKFGFFRSFVVLSVGFFLVTGLVFGVHASSVEGHASFFSITRSQRSLNARDSSLLTADMFESFRAFTDAIVAPFRKMAEAVVAVRVGNNAPVPPARSIIEDEVDVFVFQNNETGEVQVSRRDSILATTQNSTAEQRVPRSGTESADSDTYESPWSFLFNKNKPATKKSSRVASTEPIPAVQPRVQFTPVGRQQQTTSFNPSLSYDSFQFSESGELKTTTQPEELRKLSLNTVPQSTARSSVPSNLNIQHGTLSSRATTYSISSDLSSAIQFVSASLDPLNVGVGESQTLSVTFIADSNIRSVRAISELDTQLFDLDLDQVSLTGNRYVYQNAWDVFDTHSRTYITTFHVEDASGHIQTISLAWSNECTDLNHGRNVTLSRDCSLSRLGGVDGGALIIPRGKTLTLTPGTDLVYNPIQPVRVEGYLATASSGTSAGLRKGFLFYRDADKDGWARDFLPRFGAIEALGGYTRASAISNYVRTDCNDSAFSTANTCEYYPEPVSPTPTSQPTEPTQPTPVEQTPTQPVPISPPPSTSSNNEDVTIPDTDPPSMWSPPQEDEEEPIINRNTNTDTGNTSSGTQSTGSASGSANSSDSSQTNPDYECNPLRETCFTAF